MTTFITGYYNLDIGTTDPKSGYVVRPAFIDKYPNSLTVETSQSTRLSPAVTAPFSPLFYEFYTWATYSDNTFRIKLGEISYNCFYPDTGSGNISSASIQEMSVVSASGIYSGVNQVIMDFTTPPIRTIKFNYV